MSEPRKNVSKTCGKRTKSSAPVKPKGTCLNTKPAAASAVAKKNPPLAPLPSPSEAKAIADAQERTAARRVRIVASVKSENGVVNIASPHSDEIGFVLRLRDCFGTNSEAFANKALGQLGAILRRKGAASPTQTELNVGLAAIDGMRPADEIEAMLAIQMVATHDVAMEMLTRAKQAELMTTSQECGSLAVKLMRTYTAQVEALARLRRGGEQRVIVRHVSINEGGQAIVGTVNHPGVGKNERQPHARPAYTHENSGRFRKEWCRSQSMLKLA
jgi:hypothetical protein